MSPLTPTPYHSITVPDDQVAKPARKSLVSPTHVSAASLFDERPPEAQGVPDAVDVERVNTVQHESHEKVHVKDSETDPLLAVAKIKTIDFSELFDAETQPSDAKIVQPGTAHTPRMDGSPKSGLVLSASDEALVRPHRHVRNDMNVDLNRVNKECFSDPAAVECLASSLFEVRTGEAHELGAHGQSVLLHAPYGADMTEFVTKTAGVMDLRLVCLDARALVARCEDGVDEIMAAFDDVNGDESSAVLVLHNSDVLLCTPKESDPVFVLKNTFMRAVSFMAKKDALLFVTAHPDRLGDDVVQLLDIGIVPFELDGSLVRAEVFEEILEIN